MGRASTPRKASPSRSPTPRKAGGSKSPTPRPGSAPAGSAAPKKDRASLGSALKKATLGVTVTKALAGSSAPQARGDPNNIKVGVRCRPLSALEKELNEEVIAQFQGNSLCITNPSPAAGESPDHVYAYDHVYEMDSSSEQVFVDMAQPLVEGLIDGFNGTIFAYGQTGSGKTHSMMGNAEDPGVIPRVAVDLFERCAALGEGVKVSVRASYTQIYREMLEDLLGVGTEDLKIRRDPKLGTYVQGLSEQTLEDAAGLTALIDQGNKKRAVAATRMNAESSRSHAVVIIHLEQDHPPNVLAGKGKRKIKSKINLVDLAGSERASKTGATGETLKEAIAINQSLSALGNVINALTDPKQKGHIPYRSSKLTHLLEESLGGNSHTVMLAAMSPAARNYPETAQTLQYASRAKLIVTQAKANEFTEAAGRGNPFGAEQAAAMQSQMQSEMAATLAAQQEAQQAAMAEQMAMMRQAMMESMGGSMAAMLGSGGGGGGGASSEELAGVKEELAQTKAELVRSSAVAQVHASQIEMERRRADEAERRHAAAAEGVDTEVGRARREAEEAVRRAEADAARHEREAADLLLRMEAKEREVSDANAQKERVAVESLDTQLVQARLTEELRETSSQLHATQLKLASAGERAEGASRELETVRMQLRAVEAQRDQAWAREKLLDEQRASAEAHARTLAEQREQAAQQLQAALSSQLEMQRSLVSQKAAESGASASDMATSLAEVQRALSRLEAKNEAQVAAHAAADSAHTKEHEGELARLDSLLQAQAAAHAAAIEQLERRGASEASRLAEERRRSAEAAEAQLAEVQGRLREAQEARVRLQAENSTRKAAAEALGERVAMLQEQLSSLTLDGEQARHAAIAERAELEEGLRAKEEEVEAVRVHVLQHQHEAERMRQQLRERDESLARRAERLRQLQTLYERALQDKQRVEEAAWAERQELHEERRDLELRVREEAGRARQASEAADRMKHGGILDRLFAPGGRDSGGSAAPAPARPETAGGVPGAPKEAWMGEAEVPLALKAGGPAKR